MKKLFIIIAAIIGLLTTCREPADLKPEESNEQKTFIVFDNTQGICTAVVYNDYRRRDEDKIVEIPAGESSQEIEWTPGTSVPFYFLYRVNLKGISGFTLDYVPEIGKDQTAVRIDANTKTTITIPKLDETVSSPDALLSNNSYILIQNNSSYSFQFFRGSSQLTPDGSSNSLVNSGERAQYTVNSGLASNYRLLVGADYVPLPGSLVSFEAGCVYSFVFINGSLLLVSEVELKLENVAGVSPDSPIPQVPNAPLVDALNGILTVHWTSVEGAENYEVYISTTQEPPAEPQRTLQGTVTVFTGLINKTTYYVWIKAVNEYGASDFSPRARGIPWPANEVPAVPGKPVIIPGINQLTVKWEQNGGASSYEVYYNTIPSAPSLPSVSSDKTSAVITNLQNGVIYYVWVRAINSMGKSSYSIMEAGTPNIPTIAPSAPAIPVLTAGSREMTVSWQAVDFAESYEVWLGTLDNSTLAQKYGSDITGGVTETVITGLVNEITYYVWIKAKNVVGESGFSFSASCIPSAFVIIPEAPNTPTVTIGNKVLSISWQIVDGALFYEVWTGTTSNSMSAEKHGADISDTSITLTGLTNGITYYVWVRAKNNIGMSNFSSMSSGKPLGLSTPGEHITPGLYRGINKIDDRNLSLSLSYISANAITGDEFFIIIGADESISPAILNYSGKTVDITLLGYSSERIITLGSNGSMFNVRDGVTLTIGENITFLGRSANAASLVRVDGGTFVMNGGNISENIVTSSSPGGGVSINNGTFIMNGGTISGNTAAGGGGVMVGGTFIMNGGTISGNTAAGGGTDYYNHNGGGVSIGTGGTFTMNGGSISGNTVNKTGTVNDNIYNHGGGVYGINFTMNGGTISGNTAVYGGGVYGINFTMNGGIISGNIASNSGGGVVFSVTGSFIKQPNGSLYSGIIYGSEAVGNDVNGIPLKNIASSDTEGHSIFRNSTQKRNTTVGQTDQIDSSTGKGLSANGFAPFGQ